MPGIGDTPSQAAIAEDLRNLQSGAEHAEAYSEPSAFFLGVSSSSGVSLSSGFVTGQIVRVATLA